ncbi:hypothetical protein NPIL_427971 [Nephila pilipes]|uniref:Uncharacterized protein n=1 Tax=Nephila pilipes TaxID=299642 RepID=A0A8X6PG57_NEPPI|nr:hypothetical protein NPIL_427971 [Nephila pilipes]
MTGGILSLTGLMRTFPCILCVLGHLVPYGSGLENKSTSFQLLRDSFLEKFVQDICLDLGSPDRLLLPDRFPKLLVLHPDSRRRYAGFLGTSTAVLYGLLGSSH